MVVGGYYLPPSLDLAICRESLVIASEFVEDQNRNVFPVGGLWDTIEEMGFCWVQPDEGKWTIDTAIGRSIVDYVLANPQTQRTVKSTKVWEAEWAAGLDHRVVSCDTECDIHLDDPVLCHLTPSAGVPSVSGRSDLRI